MDDERERVRCGDCELVQWRDQGLCRRCRSRLPEPVVKIVERVVERVVVRHDPQCLQSIEQARELLSLATERLMQEKLDSVTPVLDGQVLKTNAFPTMAEVERTMIVAAYQRSNRKPLEAARLLGIGKTTFYRKLREISQSAAWSKPAYHVRCHNAYGRSGA